MDSMGHLHEALSGTGFRPQRESVPEQTWSSALLVSSFVGGALGLHQDGLENRLSFAPQLPPAWERVSLRHVRTGSAQADLTLERQPGADTVSLDVTGQLKVAFAPEPARGTVTQAALDGKMAPMHLEGGRTVVDLALTPGHHQARIRYATKP
jgi:hypothetical protein